MNEETYHELDFDCDYCGIETMVAYTGVYIFGKLPRGWSKDYNKISCMSGQCHEDHQDYIEEKEEPDDNDNDFIPTGRRS